MGDFLKKSNNLYFNDNSTLKDELTLFFWIFTINHPWKYTEKIVEKVDLEVKKRCTLKHYWNNVEIELKKVETLEITVKHVNKIFDRWAAGRSWRSCVSRPRLRSQSPSTEWTWARSSTWRETRLAPLHPLRLRGPLCTRTGMAKSNYSHRGGLGIEIDGHLIID